jgi:2Fe-2S ferredoxin
VCSNEAAPIPSLTIVTRNGAEHLVAGTAGASIMEIIRDSGFDELLALCGGSCACATCHVYIPCPSNVSLTEMSDDERALLDSLSSRRETSRLSCQLPFEPALDGLKVIIAPEE